MEPHEQSVVAQWNERALEAIREGAAKPTETTYQLHLSSAAVYDAWAAFEDEAYGHYSEIATSLAGSQAHKAEAISFAAFATLTELFPEQADSFVAFLAELGYDSADAVAGTGTAAGIGTLAAENVFAARADDGSNAENDFADTTGYEPVNSADPNSGRLPGDAAFDPNHWQPLRVPTGALTDEAGVPITDNDDPSTYVDQIALTPHWGDVDAFALLSNDQSRPDAPPQLGDTSDYVDGNGVETTGDQAYRDQVTEVLDVSANLTTEQKVIAEFWADGPRTESPPGHWNQIAQDIALREGHGIDEDAQLFFALNAAVFDAGIATWEAKYAYDYIRPQSAIRDLYFDETVTAWGGVNQGAQEILGQEWQPYQNVTFVTPPFPEFVSGHSAFSMAAANTIAAFVGSDQYFDGTTLGNYDLDGVKGTDLLGRYETSELVFEDFGEGPPVVLQWETLTEAALEAGASRIYGGIHIQDGNLRGLEVGEAVADSAQIRWEALFSRGGNDTIETSQAGGLTIAGAGDDTVIGKDADDIIQGGSGDDTIDGGAGMDIALFAGDLADYALTIDASGVVVTDVGASGTGIDTLTAVEALRFDDDASFVNDSTVDVATLTGAFGISTDALAGLAGLYAAHLDTAPDAFGLLFWANALNSGTSLEEIEQIFFADNEAQADRPNGFDTADYVDAGYTEFLGREADAAGRMFWIDAIDSGAIAQSAFKGALIEGARAASGALQDLQTIQDKIDIGLSYAVTNGLTDVSNAGSVMRAYNGDTAAAQALIDGFAAAAPGTEVTVHLLGFMDTASIAQAEA